MADSELDLAKDNREQQQKLEAELGGHFRDEIMHRAMIAQKSHEMGKKIIMVDIDGTICKQEGDPGDANDAYGYKKTVPFPKRIEYLNSLHDDGHFIHYWTARGCWNAIDHLQETREQLDSWGVKYNDVAVFKPFYDVWIDDKAVGVRRDSEGAISEFKANIEQAIEVL